MGPESPTPQQTPPLLAFPRSPSGMNASGAEDLDLNAISSPSVTFTPTSERLPAPSSLSPPTPNVCRVGQAPTWGQAVYRPRPDVDDSQPSKPSKFGAGHHLGLRIWKPPPMILVGSLPVAEEFGEECSFDKANFFNCTESDAQVPLLGDGGTDGSGNLAWVRS